MQKWGPGQRLLGLITLKQSQTRLEQKQCEEKESGSSGGLNGTGECKQFSLDTGPMRLVLLETINAFSCSSPAYVIVARPYHCDVGDV